MSALQRSILLFAFCLAASAGEESLRLYNVTDLLVPVVDFPATALVAYEPSHMVPTTSATDTAVAFDRSIAPLFDPAVATLIRSSSQLRDNTLFLNARPEVHAHVQRVLARQRERQSLQVQIDCVLALMEPRIRASRFTLPGLAWKPLAAQPGLLVAEQTQTEAAALVTALGGDRDVTIASHPSVTAFAGQQAHTAFVHQVAYLPLRLAERPQDHQVDVVNHGEILELRATPTDDLSLIAIKLTHRRSSLLEQRVIETGGTPAEAPIIWIGDVHIDQVVVAGHSLVIATGVYLDAKKPPQCGFLVVTPTLITADGRPVKKPAPVPVEPARE